MRANDALFPFILDLALGNPAKYGLRRPQQGILQQIAESAKIPVLDVGTTKRIAQGAIKIVPGLSAITEDGAVFEGGNKAKFDAIIFATGYRPNYRDFLEDDDINAANDGTPNEQIRNSTTFCRISESRQWLAQRNLQGGRPDRRPYCSAAKGSGCQPCMSSGSASALRTCGILLLNLWLPYHV